MIVFSDLDRSIIYSDKFLNTNSEYTNIEIYREKEISYISLDTINLIKQIQYYGMFIPTTTRTVEQFKRIGFNKYGIHFPWSITSNGGIILKNNEILKSWSERIDKLKSDYEPIESMIEKFRDYLNIDGITNFKVAEDTFFYIVVDFSKFNLDLIKEYINILESKNWRFYVSGRKIYFIPKEISKENAIKYLTKELEIESFYAIGDSIMDYGMLNISNKAYVLRHGDINKNEIENSFLLSSFSGMSGTEEILANILDESCLLNI
ncbi:HAD hydrolase family protein [Clostridioides sp. ES-S-0108-01]|uniref:HAD family hydrolase n=1 Tax=Clostridioides sp. ES-S-0108-01 TaxID=2770773 RepID=UPI001D0C3C64|nr:HAD hydrolase family protein [Clostridioides sp. ES-S-0108-01]UDN52627.1 HAD hydrolase family protein [Clostridioides sp. ES-S-0107-01]